jgi:hypothetical protein
MGCPIRAKSRHVQIVFLEERVAPWAWLISLARQDAGGRNGLTTFLVHPKTGSMAAGCN